MEFLSSIDDKPYLDDGNYEYINIFDNPQFIYGNINFSNEKTNFCKVPKIVRDESQSYGKVAIQEMNNLYNSPCGARLRFYTDSSKIIFKIKFKRKWGYQKMVNWNALGFDVYNIVGDEYKHRTVFAPKDGVNIFSEIISAPKNGCLCIFLPNYNVIEELYVGIEKNSKLLNFDYPDDKKLPIIFYGNSITQGAAASRSGNAFPNIVSKKLNRDIINLSVSSGCRGSEYMAELIGKINCFAIVIDYTRNAFSANELRGNYEKFYRKIREFHPDKKIILMTSSNFNNWYALDDYDDVVIETYKNAIQKGENTELLHQKNIFSEDEFDFVTIDGSHYTDYGMFKIADKIISLLNVKSNEEIFDKSDFFTERLKNIDVLIEENNTLKKELIIYKNQNNEITDSFHELLNCLLIDHELYPRGILKKVQILLIELLKFIDNICRKYNLHYWLDAGSLLGAIRHEGFIPWDDDLDIAMCRKDLDRLLEVIDDELKLHGLTDIFEIRRDLRVNKTWTMSFVQIVIYPEVHRQLAQIDIFPYDFIDECSQETINEYDSFKYEFYTGLMKGISRETLEKIYFEKFNLSYDYKNILIPGIEGSRSKADFYDFVPLDSSEMFPLESIKCFDGYFPCPKNSDYYLKTMYGDNYWEFPKVIKSHNVASVMKKFPGIDEFYQKYIDLMKDINNNFK